jgi:putative SOS response-associated peptidase YedK
VDESAVPYSGTKVRRRYRPAHRDAGLAEGREIVAVRDVVAEDQMALPAGSSESAAGRQFPLGGPAVSLGRYLIPASFFYEFTGTRSPKTKWKFTKVDEPWFCFAGLWRPMADGGAAFTLLTTEPGPDVAPIHDRQMVVLDRSNWSEWLEKIDNEADLLRPLPAGSLAVEQMRA